MAELKYVDWDGLVYYDGKLKEYIKDRDESYIKMGGIFKFENIPDPSYYNLNYIYKITDSFVTNDRFEEPGLICKEGTWIQCVDLLNDASKYRYIIFNEEVIGKTPEIDLSNYYTKSEVDDLIPDTENLVTKEELDTLFDSVATEEELTVLTNAVADVQEIVEEVNNDITEIKENYATTEDLKDYATINTVEQLVIKEIDEVVIERIETTVNDVVNEKIDSGNITVNKITYDTF